MRTMQLETNRKESIALRKAKSKTTSGDESDQGASATVPPDGRIGGHSMPNNSNSTMPPPQSSTSNAYAPAVAADSRADWRKVTFTSVVLGIVISLVVIR